MKKKRPAPRVKVVSSMSAEKRRERLGELKAALAETKARGMEAVRSLVRGPDKYARSDLRNRVRSLSRWSPRFGGSDEHQWFRHEAQTLLEDLVGALDRLDDAEALLDGGGR